MLNIFETKIFFFYNFLFYMLLSKLLKNITTKTANIYFTIISNRNFLFLSLIARDNLIIIWFNVFVFLKIYYTIIFIIYIIHFIIIIKYSFINVKFEL